MLHDNTSKNRQIGILFVSIATMFFTGLDASSKWLLQFMPLLQIVWLRFVFHSIMSVLLLSPKFGLTIFKVKNLKLQLLRAGMLCTITALYFGALQYLQLAESSAINFSVPILVAVISSVLMKDHLPLNQWLAIGTGFIGVLVILNPFGHSFHPAMFLALGGAIIYAFFNILTRKVAASDHPATTQLMSAVGPAILLTPFALPTWQSPSDGFQWLIIVGMGVFGFGGHYLLALAYRYAKANTLSPYSYQQIIYMTLVGMIVFNQSPGFNVVIGALIVLGSGLYLILQEIRKGD